MKISCSIVIYKNNIYEIESVIKSFCDSAANYEYEILIIDNYDQKKEIDIISNKYRNIKYLKTTKNIGYGAGHNIAIKKFENESEYHFILNPDIKFGKEVIPALIGYMINNEDIVEIMPNVKYIDGNNQLLCRLLPNPMNLIFRRFFTKNIVSRKLDESYILMNYDNEKVYEVPVQSGCFMCIRTNILKKHNILFDEQYFMYLEDYDIIRQLRKYGNIIFFPKVDIIHNHKQDSYKSKNMVKIHIQSAIKYFNKYGWLFDMERFKNNKFLEFRGKYE